MLRASTPDDGRGGLDVWSAGGSERVRASPCRMSYLERRCPFHREYNHCRSSISGPLYLDLYCFRHEIHYSQAR